MVKSLAERQLLEISTKRYAISSPCPHLRQLESPVSVCAGRGAVRAQRKIWELIGAEWWQFLSSAVAATVMRERMDRNIPRGGAKGLYV